MNASHGGKASLQGQAPGKEKKGRKITNNKGKRHVSVALNITSSSSGREETEKG